MQVVREAEDADVSDDDVNYPARVHAATELLERHCLGLRELLCQVDRLQEFAIIVQYSCKLPLYSNCGVERPSAGLRLQGLKGPAGLQLVMLPQSDCLLSFFQHSFNSSGHEQSVFCMSREISFLDMAALSATMVPRALQLRRHKLQLEGEPELSLLL